MGVFRNWTFLKCPFLKSDTISFSKKCEKVLMQSNAVNHEKIFSG